MHDLHRCCDSLLKLQYVEYRIIMAPMGKTSLFFYLEKELKPKQHYSLESKCNRILHLLR